MAEVLREQLARGSYQMPSDRLPYETQAATIALALSAAGFGDLNRAAQLGALMAYDAIEESALAEAKAQALEDAGNAPLPAPGRKGETSGFRFWLRARAAALRGQNLSQLDGEALAAAILTRRRRKCIAAGNHPDQPPDNTHPAKCPHCGL